MQLRELMHVSSECGLCVGACGVSISIDNIHETLLHNVLLIHQSASNCRQTDPPARVRKFLGPKKKNNCGGP